MGETSARRLRGGEMDDVIFAGTTARPARNIAEVALTIDNSSRDAPFAFNDREEIEIVRRIERGGGSTYRVNGREVRARDVQLLFADAASGAHSGAMVSQGRIGALIDAKPAERRLLLEEAAGTAGLHARRRETELKLDAAEENLARLDDVIATIEVQFESFEKAGAPGAALPPARRTDPADRGAAVPRPLAGRRSRGRAEFRRASCNRAHRRRGDRARRLPGRGLARRPRRRCRRCGAAEAAAAAELQRLTHARRRARAGAAARARRAPRSGTAARAARRRSRTRGSPFGRGAGVADPVVGRAGGGQPGPRRRMVRRGQRTEAGLREADACLAEAEAVLQRETEAVAAAEARRAALDRRRRELAERRARLEARRAEAERQRAGLAAALVAPEAVTAAAAAVAEAEARVEQCRAHGRSGRGRDRNPARRRAGGDRRGARKPMPGWRGSPRRPRDCKALLAPPPDAGGGAADPDGAAGRAGLRGGDRRGVRGRTPGAACQWRRPRRRPVLGRPRRGRDGCAALPEGARPLAEAVNAPSALARSLAQAGWVENEETGRASSRAWRPASGWWTVRGGLWRWDGFVSLGRGPSPAAEHLRHAQSPRRARERDRPSLEAAAGCRAERRRGACRAPASDRGRQIGSCSCVRRRGGAGPGARRGGRDQPAGIDHANPARRRRQTSSKRSAPTSPRPRRRRRRSRARSGGPARGKIGPRGARPGARCGGRGAPARSRRARGNRAAHP